MLSVITTILKILGVSILVILGFIVVLLLLILFVPIRYKANGDYKDKKIDISCQVTWLLHMVSVKLLYNNEKPFHIRFCLFGIPLYDNVRKEAKEEKRKSKKKNKKNKLEDTKPEIQAASEKNIEEIESEIHTTEEKNFKMGSDNGRVVEIEVVTKSNENDIKAEEKREEIIEENFKIDNDKVSNDESENNRKNSIFERISKKIRDIADKIKYTFKKICDTIFKIKDNIEYYVQLFQRERTKRAIEKLKNRFYRILKNIKPKKFRVNLHLGFDNPELMGKIMAVNGMLYPVHLGNIAIMPEFEQKVIEGNFDIKGRINLYIYMWTALILFLDKDIKWLIKRIKRS